MSAYCRNCGRINPGVTHPLGSCSCSRPDFPDPPKPTQPLTWDQVEELLLSDGAVEAAVNDCAKQGWFKPAGAAREILRAAISHAREQG